MAKERKLKKPKVRSVSVREKESPKDIAKRIIAIGTAMVKDITKGKDPEFTTYLRGKSNVAFDEGRGIITLGEKQTSRNFLNVGHARKFMQTTLVAAKAKDYLQHNKTASIREIYYELKHTVPNSKENTFEDQSESLCPDEPIIARFGGELRIVTARELVEFAEKKGKTIFDQNGKKRITGADIHVCGFDESGKIVEQKVDLVIRHPPNQTKLIRTSSGRNVKVTNSHSLFTITEGKIAPVKASELEVGSWVALPRRVRINENKEPVKIIENLLENSPESALEKIYVKGSREIIRQLIERIGDKKIKEFVKIKQYKNIWSDAKANWKHWNTLPVDLIKFSEADLEGIEQSLLIGCKGGKNWYKTIIQKDKNLGTVLGYLIAEGCLTKMQRNGKSERRISFNNMDEKIIGKFMHAFESVFGAECSTEKPLLCRDGTFKVNVGYDTLGYILEYGMGLRFEKAWDKEIPSMLFDAPTDFIEGFITAFRKGDGAISKTNPQARFFTTSQKLANGIVFLLLRLGVFSNIYHFQRPEPRHDYFEIRVGERSYLKTLSSVTRDFEECELAKKSLHSSDKIPGMGKTLADARKSAGCFSGQIHQRFALKQIESRNSVSRSLLTELVSVLKEGSANAEIIDALEENIASDIYWDRVVSIEDSGVPEFTMDVSVPKDQNFIGGNGFIILHNSDAIIVDLEHSIDSIREKLNLHANPKGTLYGNITLKDRMHHNDKFNCAKLGRGGWSIMSRMEPEEIEIVDVDAKYVLVIETEAMYERLVEEQFAQKNKAILVSTGGQAARGTRRLVHRLHVEEKLPVIVYTDGDPYGWYIYSVIKQGSMALAAHSEFLACPNARYVGMTLDDVETYGLQQVTEKMKDGDIKRAKEMLDYPWFQNKEWQRQLKKAIDEKIRIEQQALANKSLDFVATEYLPKKIKDEVFLP